MQQDCYFISLCTPHNNLHYATVLQCGGQNQQSTQHNNQAGVDIQQSSRSDNIHAIIFLIACVVMALLHHPTVGLSVCH